MYFLCVVCFIFSIELQNDALQVANVGASGALHHPCRKLCLRVLEASVRELPVFRVIINVLGTYY